MSIKTTRAIVTLAVTDLERARRFYGDTLGFTELETPATGGEEALVYELSQDSYIYVYERPTPSGSTATACEFAVQDVEGTVKALKQQGVTFEEYDLPEMGIRTKDGVATMEDGLKTAWLKDPDGNILAIGNSYYLWLQRERTRGSSEEAQPLPV